MSATVHNIGTPRAFGHALGETGFAYVSPYVRGTPENEAFLKGFFEGDEARHNPVGIIEPDPPKQTGGLKGA